MTMLVASSSQKLRVLMPYSAKANAATTAETTPSQERRSGSIRDRRGLAVVISHVPYPGLGPRVMPAAHDGGRRQTASDRGDHARTRSTTSVVPGTSARTVNPLAR